MTTEAALLLLLGLFCASVGAGACTSAVQQASVYLEENRVPAELRGDFECFAINCSKCHSLSRPLNAPIDSFEHWDRYVARMARTPGSGISAQEAPSILRFLHWHTQQRVARKEAKQ
jgi:hypothetical protein